MISTTVFTASLQLAAVVSSPAGSMKLLPVSCLVRVGSVGKALNAANVVSRSITGCAAPDKMRDNAFVLVDTLCSGFIEPPLVVAGSVGGDARSRLFRML